MSTGESRCETGRSGLVIATAARGSGGSCTTVVWDLSVRVADARPLLLCNKAGAFSIFHAMLCYVMLQAVMM